MNLNLEIILISVVGALSGIISAFVALRAQQVRTKIDINEAVDKRWKSICDEQQERLTELHKQLGTLQERVETQQKQIETLWERIRNGETAIIARDTRIALLESAGLAKDQKIAVLEAKIIDMQGHIARIEEENKELRRRA
jgi:TolA-binding protein